MKPLQRFVGCWRIFSTLRNVKTKKENVETASAVPKEADKVQGTQAKAKAGGRTVKSKKSSVSKEAAVPLNPVFIVKN